MVVLSKITDPITHPWLPSCFSSSLSLLASSVLQLVKNCITLFIYTKDCSSNKTTANSIFQFDLRTLLSSLKSNATGNTEFYKTKVTGRNPSDSVYGLFMCRGEVPSQLCQQCVISATQRLSSECSLSKEAVIWYDECMVRYSNRSFFSTVDTRPRAVLWNTAYTSNPDQEQSFFTTLSNMLAKVVGKVAESAERYATESLKLNALQTLYTFAQCTQDLSSDNCSGCLSDVIESAIPRSRLGSVEGRVLYPSCNVRFELFQFSRDPSGPTVGHDSANLESLQFDLAVIEAATNNFSHENKIGKGGFGEVYKGILFDGQQIAVKKLSKSSKQGANEFKNEVLLISKLQHRNLVTFIGFCLEEQEKMLIYKYVPNKSLDYFLFDTQREKLLGWFERHNIIVGIARGILYLHKHSQLKVIHRDLKPSNILLDENMIPKISNFGLARIININQDQGSTNRIVGTHGYMPPEYAMLEKFSEKSDVFSFGVMVLEIITGKKNASSYKSHCVADGLLNYVWRQWKNQTPLSKLDPNIKDNYSEIEVIKCIQIGLLCVQQNSDVRPTMVTVVSYLSCHSIELPTPQELAFYFHSQMDPKAVVMEPSSTPFSINEMSISETLSRK